MVHKVRKMTNTRKWIHSIFNHGRLGHAAALLPLLVVAACNRSNVQAAGPAEYAPVKGQVGFRGQHRIFAGVKLTRRGLEGYLDLPRQVESPRFRHIAPYTRRLFVHHFVLTSADQLDTEFSGWVREAYLVGEGITMR